MAWKEMTVSSAGNTFWVNEGLPEVETKITATRGLYVNIPSIEGGVGTILNYDTDNIYKLSDGNYINDIIYDTNKYYQITETGNGVCLELKYTATIRKIKLYVSGAIGENDISSNTFNFMTSTNGVDWVKNQSMLTSEGIYEEFSNYSSITFILPENITAKFLAIRTTTTMLLGAVIGRVRELELFTPAESFGDTNHIYQDYLTGRLYKKINNAWVTTYVPPEVLVNIIGTSAIPPSAAGIPIGSLYTVRES